MGYFLFGYMFQNCIHRFWFPSTSSKYYYPLFGVAVAIVYIICAGIVTQTGYDEKYEGALGSIDQMAGLVFIVVEFGFLIFFYFFYLQWGWYGWSLLAFGILFLINFIIAGAMIGMSSGRYG